MSNSPFRTVTIAGGTGNLGYYISEAFLNDGSYNVKILRKKPEEKNEKADSLASKGAEIVYVDYSQKDDLVKALEGTDVLVCAASGNDLYNIQFQLLSAAKETSVKRFIPSEFGCEYKLGAHIFTDSKVKFREELEKSGLEYTYIYNGLFQEYIGWMGYDIKNKEATFYVDGNTKLSSTSLSDVAKYTVESLKISDARNASIRVAGSVLSLNEILQKFEETTGSKWKVVEDKEVRHRFQNQIAPIPTMLDDFRVVILENGEFKKLDNDKFNFTPRPITEVINVMVK